MRKFYEEPAVDVTRFEMNEDITMGGAIDLSNQVTEGVEDW